VIPEIGHYALILATLMALIQSVLPQWGAWRVDRTLMDVGRPAALAQFVFILVAFAALTYAYVVSDFSVLNVFQNSHSAKPLIYKISGVWGNHEGSMVLWVLMLAVFGAGVALFGDNLPPTLRARVLGVQGLIAFGFLLFILVTSNPFERLDPVPVNGRDLNPLLQDPGLAFHPPFLYLGYVGFSIAFSFAIAALLEGRVDPAWARWVRPWTLIAWASLTLGIAMGSWWAYYELGWGGWWFWDPVENASLMPWIAGTALLHSLIVLEKRDTLKRWTMLLAILTFTTSLLGTFLVRSGVLTSVHAFATDPDRGAFILVLFGLTVGGALLLFAIRNKSLAPGGMFQMISRESALVLNNFMLAILLGLVLIGTLFPLMAKGFMGYTVSIGPPFFNLVTIPFAALLIALLPIGTMMPWKRADLAGVLERLRLATALTLIALLVALFWTWGGPVLAFLGIVMAAWAFFGAVTDLAERIKLFKIPLKQSWNRAVGLPRSAWGTCLAHAGMGITIAGMTGTSLWVSERIEVMRPGETLEIAGYELVFNGVQEFAVDNYQTQMGNFTLKDGDRVLGTLTPELRWFPVAEQVTTEASVYPKWAEDIYVAIGDPREGGGRVVRAYHHPLVQWLWAGSVIMTLGGLISLTDRRYRVGAPRPAKAPRRKSEGEGRGAGSGDAAAAPAE